MNTKSEYPIQKTLANIIVLCVAVAFYFLMSNMGNILGWLGRFLRMLTPFFIGIFIAYLLARPVDFFDLKFQKHLFKKHKNRRGLSRAAAVVSVVLSVLIFIALTLYFIIPQLINSIHMLSESMPEYIDSLTALAERFQIKNNLKSAIDGFWQNNVSGITDYISDSLPEVMELSKRFTTGLINFLLGFVISLYLIAGKERFVAQLKKTLFAIFPNKAVTALVRLGRYTNNTFGKYISGKLLVSLILGLLCFPIMLLFRMKYALLISFIVAVTNIIPFFGGIFGAVAAGFIMLMAEPSKVTWLIILIITLQQLDGNILSPQIVGKSLRLPAFWVIFSIIVGGGYFGIIGIIVSVPIFSVLYILIKSLIEKRLGDKKMPIETGSYNSSTFPL